MNSFKNYKLCVPFACLILLAQCDSKDSDSNADSSQPDNSRSNERSLTSRGDGNQAQGGGASGSGSARNGGGQSTGVPKLPDENLNRIAVQNADPSDWELKIGVLNEGMKTAIASGDTQALLKNFKEAVKMNGDSPSSSSAVLSGLVPELDGKLDMARSLIDSMDGDQLILASSAHSIALTIEDEEERKQWVQSLANPEVSKEVLRLLSPE